MEDLMATDNREKSRRIFEEVWNQRKVEQIDELVATDYVHHDVLSSDQKGVEAYKQFVDLYLNAFPDIRFNIEDEVSDGDTVVIRWAVTGTHNGDLPGLRRTGRPISVTGITIARLRDGKFVESWNNWDALGMMQQLGAVPAEAKSRAA
jgi:steroid delta-isomerase-like uncharacterized protein